MAYDWKKLERDENQRSDRQSRAFAVSWMAVGVLGPVVGFLITGSFRWENGVIFLAMGLVVLVPILVIERRRRRR